ncbi:MAG: hypothetical protein ACRDRT_04530, partial [Pseudonocardiaceae bacterium]
MTLMIVLIALLIVVVAGCLRTLGVLLTRTADNLEDCGQSVKMLDRHARVVGLAVEHLNRTGGLLAEELAHLHDGAERLLAVSPAMRPGRGLRP